MLHVRPSDYRVMPWKDGGGSTTEIAIEPAGSSLSDPFLWRASMARVEASGPFSRFPGYERSLVLLEGAGLLLDIEDKGRQRLKPTGQPVVFSGDDAVSATLIQGPCVDFGVISDPRRVQATLQWLTVGPDAISLTLGAATLLFAPRGAVQVDPLGVQLDPMDALRLGGASAEPALGIGSKIGVRAPMAGTPLVVVTFQPV
ncbi:MAG TPA: HutD family protein [Geothrix sp.]|jgi:hypothetical protein